MNKKLLLLPLLLIALVGCHTTPSRTGTDYGPILTVYSFNDVHGQMEGDDEYIGLDRAATYIKNQEGYIEEMTLLLAAGDMFQGSGVSNLTDGQAMVDVMNAMKFDSMTVGNHEFDWTVEKLKNNIENSDFPYVSYDIIDQATDEPVSWVDPYAIIQKGVYKVGIIGEIGNIESSIASSMIEGLEFKPDVNKINSLAKELKNKKNCDVVFLLTHNGPVSTYRDLDDRYVKAIFGGHTHDVVRSTTFGNIPYLQGGQKTQGISSLTYNFKTEELDYNVKTFTKNELTAIEKDVYVSSVIAEHLEATAPILNEVVGKTNGLFNAAKLGKLVTKAMFDYAVSQGVSSENLIAVHNQRGIRVDSIGEYDKEVDVTYGDIYEAYPFDNDVRLVQLKGSIFKNSTGNYFYGIESLALLDSDTVYNVISISYLTENETGLFYNEGGGQCLSDSLVYCRNLVSQLFRDAKVLNAADF